MQWLLQIALMMGIPYVLRVISNWRKTPVRTKQQFRMQQWEMQKGKSWLSTILLMIALGFYAYEILNPTISVFSKLEISPYSKTFQVRNSLREYLRGQEPSSPEFKIDSFDKVSLSDAKNEYDKLKVWYELTKNKSKRQLYNTYGDAIYCEFCVDEMDYAFYFAPTVLKCYLGVFLLIGLVSMSFQKAKWRLPATIFAGSMLLSEMSLIFMTKEVLDALQYTYKWEKADKVRHVMFFLLTVAILVKNRPNITQQDKEQLYCDELEQLSSKAFKISKVLQLKQQANGISSIGPTHPVKKHLLQQVLIEKEI